MAQFIVVDFEFTYYNKPVLNYRALLSLIFIQSRQVLLWSSA